GTEEAKMLAEGKSDDESPSYMEEEALEATFVEEEN
ncbi:hypothetical protein LCGC14_2033670, partial [marine sediment metagenome]